LISAILCGCSGNNGSSENTAVEVSADITAENETETDTGKNNVTDTASKTTSSETDEPKETTGKESEETRSTKVTEVTPLPEVDIPDGIKTKY